ncbi:MAG: AtpZ/AtpI family protein [archaeon]|nr:AtpZ/AtpI family protein [archaeon]
MEINWVRAIGASFDIAISILVCAFIGYYLGGGRLNEVTPLSIFGLVIGALFGLFIVIYSLIRMFGAAGGKR